MIPSKLYKDQFEGHYDVVNSVAPKKTILIASTPRSGSHMLGHTMIKTAQMGVPFEYCNPPIMRQWKQELGLETVQEVMTTLMKKRTSSNGVFSLKMHLEHLDAFGGLAETISFFPNVKIIRIVRSDLLRQAVSLSVAGQTGIWISGQTGKGQEAKYSKVLIEDCIHNLIGQNYKWSKQIAEHNLSSLTVEFEQFIDDPGTVITQIAKFADIDTSTIPKIEAPATLKQSGPRSADWCEKYLKSYEDDRQRKHIIKGSVKSVLKRFKG